MKINKIVRTKKKKQGIKQEEFTCMKIPGRNEIDAPITYLIFFNSKPYWILKTCRNTDFSQKIVDEALAVEKSMRLKEVSERTPKFLSSGENQGYAYFIMLYNKGTQNIDKCIRSQSNIGRWLKKFNSETLIEGDKFIDVNKKEEWPKLYEVFDQETIQKYWSRVELKPRHVTKCQVHGDFNYINLLWNTQTFSVIDWELSCEGWSYFDPCFFIGQLSINNSDVQYFADKLEFFSGKFEESSHFTQNLIFMPLFIADILNKDYGSHTFSLRSKAALEQSMKYILEEAVQ